MLPHLSCLAAVGLAMAAGIALSFPVGLAAAEPAWEGKTVILTRAGVRLQTPGGRTSRRRRRGLPVT
jgi:hypothetical protein